MGHRSQVKETPQANFRVGGQRTGPEGRGQQERSWGSDHGGLCCQMGQITPHSIGNAVPQRDEGADMILALCGGNYPGGSIG